MTKKKAKVVKEQEKINFTKHCKRCGRVLKNPEAIKKGFGSVCFSKINIVRLKNLF